MTYREALETNKRSYRYMMMKNKIYTDSPRRAMNGRRSVDFSSDGEYGSKNIVKIFIPGGTVINLFNIIEFSSPSGISLKASLPFLGGDVKNSIGSLVSKFTDLSGQPDGFISITRVDDKIHDK
jgi:hypothetical protein